MDFFPLVVEPSGLPVLPAGAGRGLLAWRAFQRTGATVASGNLWATRLLALAAGVVCVLANYLWSPWLNYIAFLMGLIAAFWGLGGKPVLQAFVPVILMLLTILPPPFNWDQSLVVPWRWAPAVRCWTACTCPI